MYQITPENHSSTNIGKQTDFSFSTDQNIKAQYIMK